MFGAVFTIWLPLLLDNDFVIFSMEGIEKQFGLYSMWLFNMVFIIDTLEKFHLASKFISNVM